MPELRRSDDKEIFSTSLKQKRVRDLLDNRKFPPHRNPGVVVFVVGACGVVVERLMRAFAIMQVYLKVFGASYMVGTKIVFSDDEHVAIEMCHHNGYLSNYALLDAPTRSGYGMGVNLTQWASCD